MKLRHGLIALALGLASVGSALADTTVLTFEGINSSTSSETPIESFYNGGGGPNYGITFSSNALALCLNSLDVTCSDTSRGGLGDPNSQQGALFFADGSQTVMNDPTGFTTGVSLVYTAPNVGGYVSIYSGLDGTGTLLGTVDLATTNPTGCPDYNAALCPFFPAGLTFAGTAESVAFGGAANQIVFDDVSLLGTPSVQPSNPAPVPEPAPIVMLATGLCAAAIPLRRKLLA
jgi:hypothetical protein